jgi:glycosyltransferase involved in cell wall biosynthesis
MRVVVVTCAHRGDDARISHRQITALLAAGHQVTLVAPTPTPFVRDGFEHRAIRRAVGRRRLRAWADARRAVRRAVAVGVDVVIVHDIELLPVVRRAGRAVMVWDVHEDYAAAITDRRWIPAVSRRPIRWLVVLTEAIASRRCRVILAETSYRGRHPDAPVVPNTTVVPPEFADLDRSRNRVVYLGRISRSRGLLEMIELGRRSGVAYVVELIGAVDRADAEELERAVESGFVVWHGYVANDEALRLVEGALVGLSLLRDAPNFVHSMPTKLVEYLSRGVPVISTRLGVAESLVQDAGGVLVDVGDVDAAEAAIRSLIDDPELRRRLAREGHDHVAVHQNWSVDGPEFVRVLESMAVTGS